MIVFRAAARSAVVCIVAGWFTLAGLGLAGLVTPARADDRVPRPDIVIAHPGHCIAPTEYMRRNHFALLLHQREITVRQGVRGARVQLRECIACHASRETHSVLGSDRNFCQACHAFVAVRIDCFECHNPRTGDAPAGAQNIHLSTASAEPARMP